MNLDRLMGLKELFDEQVDKYVIEHTGIEKRLLGRDHILEERSLSGITIHNTEGFPFVITENEDFDLIRRFFGVDKPYTKATLPDMSMPSSADERCKYLQDRGYVLFDTYPDLKDARFAILVWKRSNSAGPFVYASVSKHVG